MRAKNLVRWAVVTAVLLMVPLVAMQFTKEVVWTAFDFVVAGTLLFGAACVYELVASRGRVPSYRIAAALAVGTGLFLVWSNLAVGIIGDEDNPANLMYAAVLAVGVVGALAARFRPQGMSRVLIAMAVVQIAVSVVAEVKGLGSPLPIDAFFATLWLGSSLLFRRAGTIEAARAAS